MYLQNKNRSIKSLERTTIAIHIPAALHKKYVGSIIPLIVTYGYIFISQLFLIEG